MRAKKYLVTSRINGIEREHPWDPEEELALDPAKQYSLASQSDSAVLKLQGKALAKTKNASSPGEKVSLKAQAASVSIRHLRAIKAPFVPDPEKDTKGSTINQSMVFSGIGNLVLSSHSIKTAYVAYSINTPVFTLKLGTTESEVKPIFDGVKLKLRGKKAVSGKIGEPWRVDNEELMNATVIRGSRWWKFSQVKLTDYVPEFDELDFDSETLSENRQIKKILTWLGGALALMFLVLILVPTPEKETKEEEVEKPVERIRVLRKKRVVPKKTVEKVIRTERKVSAPPKSTSKKAQAAPAKKSKPSASSRSGGAQAAKARLGALRSAFKDALSLTQKKGGAPVVGTKGAAGVFGKGEAALSPTEVKPGYRKSGVKSQGLSSGVGDTSGLVASDRSRATGGGPSFREVGTGDPEVDEGLTKEEVGRVIHEHLREIRACHESAMLYNPRVAGKISVRFVISAAGRVIESAIESSDVGSSYLEDCILKKIPRWKFPRPKNGVEVNVSYPFLFKTLRR